MGEQMENDCFLYDFASGECPFTACLSAAGLQAPLASFPELVSWEVHGKEGLAASLGRSCFGLIWHSSYGCRLDTVVKTNKYDTCAIKRKKYVLFPTTDSTAGVLFTELSECEHRREAGAGGQNLRFWFYLIPCGTQQFCDCSLSVN